ncbi:MAG: hypothetical protein V7641_5330, partial [Blastocatellia bacterium]
MSIEDAVEQLAEIADESVIPPPPSEDEIAAEQAGPMAEPADAQVEEFFIERITDEPYEAQYEAPGESDSEALTDIAAAPVEEAAAEAVEGKSRRRSRKQVVEKPEPKSRRKGAKAEVQKADVQKEAAPPAASPKASARKSSGKPTARKSRRGATAESHVGTALAVEENFQRITDEDLASDAGDLLKDAIVQEKIIEQVHQAEYATPSVVREPEPEWRVGSFRAAVVEDEGFQRIVDESAPPAKSDNRDKQISVSETTKTEEAEDATVAPFRHIGEALPGWLRERLDAVGMNDASPDAGDAGSQSSEAGDAVSAEEDRDAEVRDRGSRAEFSQRRGGRGRRRRHPGAPPPQQAGAVGASDEAPEGDVEAESAEPFVEEAPRAEAPRPETPRPVAPRAERAEASRSAAPRTEAPRPRYERRGDSRRPEPRSDQRPDPRSDQRADQRPDPQRQSSRRPERSGPPTISELLHEGQEILVQIAKEPIAKKGARITSHIALPGRYLVYMPTVNHVGVSRKIPSDQERIRLK